MAYTTIQNAIDYYTGHLAELGNTSIVPPRLTIAPPNNIDTNGDLWLGVSEQKIHNTDKVLAICFHLSSKAVNSLGPISFEEYSTLEQELEVALTEYRRIAFKRISRQQRHIDEKNKNTR